MQRRLLVDQVSFGGVAIPADAEVRLTWRRIASGETDWSATVTLPGAVGVPKSGQFVGRAATGAVAGEAVATVSVDSGRGATRTTISWVGSGELSLPD